jgi:iron complex outermembrane receptor protein
MTWRNSYRSSLLISAAIAATAVAGVAQAQTRTFDIPAQDAVTGIPNFARQAGLQILVSGSAVRGVKTKAVIGAFTPEAGLRQLLDGTGLQVASQNGRTVTLAAPPQAEGAAGSASPETVSEVVVTGSWLRNQTNSPVPVNTYSARDIAQSGQVRLEGYLNNLPEVSVAGGGSTINRFGATTTVRLRGLPEGTTAVLIDGRRTAVAGINVSAAFDVGSIPPAIVERVDVQPIGSSAIYGSDAIGGVVNIILKRRFEGVDASASYSVGAQRQERGVSLAAGKVWQKGALSAVVSYQDNDGLYGFDRALTRSNDYTRYADRGGLDYRYPYCAPGTVRAVSGVLSGLGTAVAAIPATGADQVANYSAGGQNLCNMFATYKLIPSSWRLSALVSGEYELSDKVTAYASMLASKIEMDSQGAAGRIVTSAVVPASNPFNPFGQAVTVTTILPPTSPSDSMFGSQSLRPLVGLRGRLGDNWDWDVSAWMTLVQETATQSISGGTAAVLPALLARTDKATAFNLFDPASNSAALIKEASPTAKLSSHGEQVDTMGILRGDLFDLPAGPVKTAFGFEARRESFNSRSYNGFTPVYADGSRTAWALFGEASVPLLGGSGGSPLLEATLAGRYDSYNDFGDKFTPAVGLSLRAFDGLRLGATYSTSFKAPGLTWMNFQTFSYPNTTGYYDPRRGEAATFQLYTGGNPNLKPEIGDALAFTANWDSRKIPGLHAGLTYWELSLDDRIGSLAIQDVLNNEALFPGRVVRAADEGGLPGRIISVTNTYINYGGLRVRGVDLSARYLWDTAYGTFTPSVALTRTLEYRSQLRPDQPFVDSLAKATTASGWAPRYKATVGLAWHGGGVSAQVQGRYLGRYLDYQPRPNTNHLGDDWFMDGSIEAPLSLVSASDIAKRAYVRVSATNLLNKMPEYSNFNAFGWDAYQTDIVGRMVTMTLGFRF